jgi:UDP-N-acetylmuramyl pentapeptide synthase
LHYRLTELPSILRSPGRGFVLSLFITLRGRPVLFGLAKLYRRTLLARTRVIAVVGSYGKTTTQRAVCAALDLPPERWLGRTQHGRLALAVLATGPGGRAVFEAAITRPGEMTRSADLLRPSIVVVTSIGSEHNRSFATLEVTRHEKAEMIRVLPPTGLAVLNGDDSRVRWMAGQTRARVVTFGLDASNDVWADEIALDWPAGTRFRLHAAGQVRAACTRLVGRHQIRAVLAAVAVALAEGIDLDLALARLAVLPPTPGRLQPVPLPSGAILLRDDFKSSVETIDAALDLLAEIPARRKIVLLGAISEPPGSSGPSYRRLGARLAEVATQVVVVGDGYRRYAAGASRAGMPRPALADAGHLFMRAVELLPPDLAAGDVVLIKGRSSQRLERAALALQGRVVGCDLVACQAPRWISCERCPVRERGWQGQRALP